MLFTTFTCLHKGGVLFKGNLRGKPSKSYEKITNRLEVMRYLKSWPSEICASKSVSNLIVLTPGYQQNKFGDQYKLFLLINPEDEKPIAVVIPRQTLQPETTGNKIYYAVGNT